MLLFILLLLHGASALKLNGHTITFSLGGGGGMKDELKNALAFEDLWLIEGKPFMGEILDRNHSFFYGTEPKGRLHTKMLPEYKYQKDKVNLGCNRVDARVQGKYVHFPCVHDVAALATNTSYYWFEVNEKAPHYYSEDTTPVGERFEVTAGSAYFNDQNSGQGETVFVIDTGLDTDHRMFYSAVGTFPIQDYRVVQVPESTHSKIIGLFHQFGANIVNGSHGTAVSSVVAGYNNGMGVSGIAPAAKLAFLDVSLDGNSLLLSSSTIMNMFERGRSLGAEVMVHSYGDCSSNGGYPLFSSRFDEYTWNNPYVVHVVAAGNYDFFNCPGVRGLSSPATAKNVISVGASFSTPSYYESFLTRAGGFGLYTTESVTSFSQYGPLADGRTAPTVYAPGYQEDVAFGSINGVDHETMSVSDGTSFSAPIVAGMVLLARQYYREQFSEKLYGATAKALLLARAAPMKRVISGTTGLTQPNHEFGYGFSKLGDLSEMQWVNGRMVNDGQRIAYTIENFEQGAIAWYDRAASANIGETLINDFNAFFIDSNGNRLNSHNTKNAEEIARHPSPGPVRVVIIADLVDSQSMVSLVAKGTSISDADTCLPGETRACENGLEHCTATGWSSCMLSRCVTGWGGFGCSTETMRLTCHLDNAEGEQDMYGNCLAVQCSNTNHVITSNSGCSCVYPSTTFSENGQTSTSACTDLPPAQSVIRANSAATMSPSNFVYIILFLIFM
jgi:hypothetical protein